MKQWSCPPEMNLDLNLKYFAKIETARGDIEMQLFPLCAPKTVNNFVFLVKEEFYNGLVFHRVIKDFVIQGGDPRGSGVGGPGYKFEDEFYNNPLFHDAGVISMANAGPNTNGSQFFITHSPQHHLDGKHTVFGKVIRGMDVVHSIKQGDVMERVTVFNNE